jgi:hypothetical protein
MQRRPEYAVHRDGYCIYNAVIVPGGCGTARAIVMLLLVNIACELLASLIEESLFASRYIEKCTFRCLQPHLRCAVETIHTTNERARF